MSKTQLQTNNTRLASLITELQGKAAGGGSGEESIETCTVNIVSTYGRLFYIGGVTVSDGVMEPVAYKAVDESGYHVTAFTFANAARNTLMAISCDSRIVPGYTAIGAELLLKSSNIYFFKITAAAGETVSITLTEDD